MSLRDTLESLANTAPVNASFDPEAISDEALGLDTLDYDNSNSYDQFEDDLGPSTMPSLRRQSDLNLALEEDAKYAGKRVNVSKLKESGILLDDSEDEDGDLDSDVEFDGMSFETPSESEEFSEDEDLPQEPNAVYKAPKVRLTGDIERDTEAELQALAAADAQALSRYKSVEIEDGKKGLAVKEQISDIERALEFRIQLQKTLALSHKLPRYPQAEEFQRNSKKVQTVYSELRNQCADIVLEALYLQSAAIASTPKLAERVSHTLHLDIDGIEERIQEIEQYLLPEPVHDMALLSGSKRQRSTQSEEDMVDEDEAAENQRVYCGDQVTTEELWESVSRCWTSIGPWRDDTLDTWGRKLLLTSGLSSKAAQKLKVIGTNISEQVAESMQNIDRLISRTRLKKSAIQVIGQPPVAEDPTNADSTELELDDETYDDADFYANLLKEYISLTASSEHGSKSAGGIHAKQGYTRTTRKNVDRKASKSRKLK